MSIDPRLRLRHLRSFMEVARAGTVAAAAERLSITQPAVSKTLRELEEIAGCALFDRSGRRLTLNEAGRLFQRFAGLGVAELERAFRAVGAAGARAALSIGVLPSAAAELAPRAALTFRAANPHCALRVLTGPNWLLLSQLREGRLDLVVGRMAAPAEMTALTFERLYAERVALVARPGHPLAGETVKDGAALADWPLIAPPRGALIRETVDAFLIHAGLAGRPPLFETVSLAFGRGAVLRSDALWFISLGVVAEELRSGTLIEIPLAHPMLAGPIGVSLREDAEPNPEREALIAALRAAASNRSAPEEMRADGAKGADPFAQGQ